MEWKVYRHSMNPPTVDFVGRVYALNAEEALNKAKAMISVAGRDVLQLRRCDCQDLDTIHASEVMLAQSQGRCPPWAPPKFGVGKHQKAADKGLTNRGTTVVVSGTEPEGMAARRGHMATATTTKGNGAKRTSSSKKKAKAPAKQAVKAKANGTSKANGDKSVIWRSVLRLPKKTAVRLKRAVKAHNKGRDGEDQLSINSTIETIIEVWLTEEGY